MTSKPRGHKVLKVLIKTIRCQSASRFAESESGVLAVLGCFWGFDPLSSPTSLFYDLSNSPLFL